MGSGGKNKCNNNNFIRGSISVPIPGRSLRFRVICLTGDTHSNVTRILQYAASLSVEYMIVVWVAVLIIPTFYGFSGLADARWLVPAPELQKEGAVLAGGRVHGQVCLEEGVPQEHQVIWV